MLTQSIQPDGGKIVIGETVKFGYYTQGGIKAKPNQKVIDVVRDYGDYIPLAKGRQISAQQLLERFLFDRKKQYDFVEKLSGGEQKRLYLCRVLIQNPNFLILDEPTNDLDIVTLNVLESFLMDFPGCLLVVSHDRYFMDKIVDHLFVFQGEVIIVLMKVANLNNKLNLKNKKILQL
jgi:ATP-binding cassette subfamily F protein uup